MKTRPIAVRLDLKLLSRLDEFAEEHGYHRSEAIKEAIRKFIRK